MATGRQPVNAYEHYHAHVYFDALTSEFAKRLCREIGERFGLEVGRHHERPVGPHPCWSCQVSFDARDFDTLIPWLEANRKGLDVLVHGLTGNDMADHTDHAYWLGEAHPLKVEIFRDKR